MSFEYSEYIVNHISRVNTCMEWMNRHKVASCPIHIHNHDDSKFSEEEYDAYDMKFYGKSDFRYIEDVTQEEIDREFDYAWLHHIHNNPHHWQYWLLHEDDGGFKPLEMPINYVYEMVADWWSFSWAKNKREEIFSWYEEHKDKMVLHPATRALVEDILAKIKEEMAKPTTYGLLETEEWL